jgi:glutathione S-transferase
VIDLRVRLSLGESGIRYEVVTGHGDQKPGLPLYIASDGSTAAGDSAILTYLVKRAEGIHSGAVPLRGGDYLPIIDQFLLHWREHRTNNPTQVFEFGFEDWERVLDGQHYLGGTVLAIDDCSLWPVFWEIMQTQGAFDARFTNVNQYYQRVAKRGIVRSILEE